MDTPSVGDVIARELAAVRKLAAEVLDAEESLRQWHYRLQDTAVKAAAAGVPKSAIAAAAGVSRGTLYAWLAFAADPSGV